MDEPKIRFYAGCPLTNLDGSNLGLGLAQSALLEIAWPSGCLSVHDLEADQLVVIGEESSGPPPTGSAIEIIAAGRNNQESMALQIDGVTVANFDNVGGDALTGTFEVYIYSHPTVVSADRIRVAFTNDLHGTDPAIWRDLRVVPSK